MKNALIFLLINTACVPKHSDLPHHPGSPRAECYRVASARYVKDTDACVSEEECDWDGYGERLRKEQEACP